MNSVPTKSTGSPLAKLRINRPQTRGRGGRGWARIGVWFGGLLLLMLSGALIAVFAGLVPDDLSWERMAAAVQGKPEVRRAKLSVQRGQAAEASVVASGYLESRRQAKIGARAPGRIERVNVEEGSRVTMEEVLAVLEHADLDASLKAAEASLAGSQAQLAEQQIEIERLARDLERAERLRTSRSISDADYDAARFNHDAAVARKNSLQASVALAEARVAEAEQMKENMFIRAPFDGTVISKDAEVGESILPGGMGEASGRGSVVTIADLEHLEVDCDVKEGYISRIEIGQPAEVAVDAVPGRRYHGEVRKVIPMGDRARATIKVKVAILDADERLFPEMSSTVYFIPPEAAQATDLPDEPRVFVDSSAVEEDSGGESFVWVVTDEQRLQKVTVTTGAERDSTVEILSGLNGGERVVIAPDDVQANQIVKVLE